jgi:hypothetical protein
MSLRTSLLGTLLIFLLALQAVPSFASEAHNANAPKLVSTTGKEPVLVVKSHESLLLLISGLVSFSIALALKRELAKNRLDLTHSDD